MINYQFTVYRGQNRPTDIEKIEDFVIQPQKPWFGSAEQQVVKRSLRNGLDNMEDCWVIARDNGQPIATVWIQLANDNLRTGLMGFVLTDPRYRGQGLAKRLCQLALQNAERHGCKIMILGTGNPYAKILYEKIGFYSYYKGHMYWPANAPEKRPIAYGNADKIRPTRWSDLAAIVRYIIDPQNQTLVDHFENLTRENGLLSQTRTASTGKALLLRAEQPGHAMWVLVNHHNQIQGLASVLIDPQSTSQQRWLQLYIHPACQNRAAELTQHALEWARQQGLQQIAAFTAQTDQTHIDALRTCQFQPADQPLTQSLTQPFEQQWLLKL